MSDGQREASARTLVHNVLDLVPQCLLRPDEFKMVADSFPGASIDVSGELDLVDYVAQYLLQLITDCLQMRKAALEAAEDIRRRLQPRKHSTFQVAAAWDTFLRRFAVNPDEELRNFLLLNYWSFKAPGLLTELVRGYESVPSSPLAAAQVLACRHLLGSTVAELAAIRSAFPNLRFVEVLGKPYSANRAAVLELERRGFSVDRTSCVLPQWDPSSFGGFATTHKLTVRAAVDRLIANTENETEPLLVIDDGGALIDAVGQAVCAQRLRRPVVAVEQTTHGMFAARPVLRQDMVRQHGFAVINVAESFGKLMHESPIIAKSVVNETWEWLRFHSSAFPHRVENLRFGVVGYGTVGSYVVAQLRGLSLNVQVYDRSRHKASVAGANGIPIARSISEFLETSDVIIGASGGTSIDSNAAEELRDGTILISASSGDKEFSGLRGWPMDVTPLLPSRSRPDSFDEVHGLRTARSHDGRVVYIVNGGFPVNFDGSIDPIRPDLIQLTRTLVVAAVIQAGDTKSNSPSIVGATGEFDLDKSREEGIVERFHSLSIRD